MRTFDPRAPLIFIHVPKTAGIAVRQIVSNWFPNRFHLHYYNEALAKKPDLLPLHDPKFVENPPVIYGHFNKHRGFGIEDYYPQVTQFVTILRDPFDMAISSYFYIRKNAALWKDQTRVPDANLETFLGEATSRMLYHFPREMNLHNYKDIIEEFFIEIGIMEDLGHSLERISQRLGRPFDPATLKVVNATERDQAVPYEFREAFNDRNPLEHAVYEFARSQMAAS